MMNGLRHFLKATPSKDTHSNNMAKFFHGTHKGAAFLIGKEGLKPVNKQDPELRRQVDTSNSTRSNQDKTYKADEWSKYQETMNKLTHKNTSFDEQTKMNTILHEDKEIRKLEKVNPFWRRPDMAEFREGYKEALANKGFNPNIFEPEKDEESHDKKWKYDYTMGWEKPAIRTKLKLVNPNDLEFQESEEDKDKWKIENIKDSGEIREPVEAWNKYGPTQKLQIKDGHHRTIAARERGDKLIPVLIYDKQLDRDYHRKRNKLSPYDKSEE